MYTWVYKRETPARRELDPISKQIEYIYVGIQAQNTSKKGVRSKKKANRMYTWVYKRKIPARRELNPKRKKIECIWVYKRKTLARRELDPKGKQTKCIR